MLDRIQRENVELRLKVDTLTWALAEVRGTRPPTPVFIPRIKGFQPKTCVECGNMFIPVSGRQQRCEECRARC